jgi:hypothetical protein
MNRSAVVVGLMVLVGLCLVGLGFELGRSHDAVGTTTTTTAQAPQSGSGLKWWNGVKSQVQQIANAETNAYTEWDVFCTPGFNQSDCSQALPYLTPLNGACASFNPSTSGATKDEVKALNELEAACEVEWLAPTRLGQSEFDAVMDSAANLEIVSSFR